MKADRIVLEKRPAFKLRPANFEKVVWRDIPEASTRTAELLAGNVDIITNVRLTRSRQSTRAQSAKVVPVQRHTPHLCRLQSERTSSEHPGWQGDHQEPEVRRALQYAVDVPTICEQLLERDMHAGHRSRQRAERQPDLQAISLRSGDGREASRRSGLPKKDGVRFEITLQAPNGRYYNDANVALAVGQFLTDIGVKTKVELMEWASVYTPLIRKKEAGPMFFLGSGGGTWNALYDMADLSAPDAGTNYTNWNNPDFFAGWAELAVKKPLAEQRKTIDRMLKIFYDESALAADVLPAGLLRRQQAHRLAAAPGREDRHQRSQAEVAICARRARGGRALSRRGKSSQRCGHYRPPPCAERNRDRGRDADHFRRPAYGRRPDISFM